jgi:general secretion pathway protein A
MYAPFFGLTQEPFSIAPDPRYLFMSERHREALAHLLYGAQGGGGFVLLTGEIGAGKTTIARCFMEQVPAHCQVAYIFNPRLTVIELLRSICDDFGIDYVRHAPGDVTIKDYIDPLNEHLLRTHAQGKSNILIIDEAQMLPPDVLEQLRLLTNLETSERKLLQIMLIGQPELREMLERPELEQLAQRVIARYHLAALNAGETAQYIAHRLTVAGLRTAVPFSPDAVKRIQRWTRGVPRRINLLCDRAMLGAYSQGLAQVDRTIVDKAAHEVFGRLLNKRTGELQRSEPTAEPEGRHSESASTKGHWSKAALWAMAGLGGTALVAGTVLALRPASRPSAPNWWARPAASAAPQPQAQGSPPASAAPDVLPAEPASAAPRVPAAAPVSAWAPTLSQTPPTTVNFTGLAQDESQAWVALGSLWKVSLGVQSPCDDATAAHLACYRSEEGLAVIRQITRPGIVTLTDEQGRHAYALITGWGPQSVTLRMGSSTQTVPLTAMAKVWQGDFATLWLTPPDYRRKLVRGTKGAAVDWLATRLATLQGEPAPPPGTRFGSELEAKVKAFQLAQGLKPDGVAGSTTLMQLNRATGVDEPRLTTEK